MRKLVVVAMSGGVDSSVAAALLQKKGYEVVGLTMCFGLKEAGTKKPSCCGLEGIEDARKVAAKLGIKHYVLNFDKYLRDKVIKDFLGEYLAGRTPNPCIRCNQYLKFGELLKKARSLGAKYLATGHYVKKVTRHKTQDTSKSEIACLAARPLALPFPPPRRPSVTSEVIPCNDNIFVLKKGKDEYKDQSYFLYRVNQEQLGHLLFPLGGYTKEEVRDLARSFGLSVAEKPGSQEVCFIPDNDYRKFLGERKCSGLILDTAGNILGKHKGIAYYTIGQREGLNIAKGYPLYVIKIDARDNSIIVGKKEEAFFSGCVVKDLSFVNGQGEVLPPLSPPRRPSATSEVISLVLAVKIRYNHQEIPSRVTLISKNRAKVIFSLPQFAVAPGQAAVFYKGDAVIGGGVIESSI